MAGKAAATEAACSVWGGATFKRSWRATANGMEGAAATFNDCLLALDELSECNPRDVAAIDYALGNGQGKQRADRYGRARSVTRWRCFVISTGEKTPETSMAGVGIRMQAGQKVRLLDVRVARRFGAWDDLHGAAGGAAFSEGLREAAKKHYGHAGRAFLERLTQDERDLTDEFDRIKAQFSIGIQDGQAVRAGRRFALMALAGEMASEYGITDWPAGAATDAALELFLGLFGGLTLNGR